MEDLPELSILFYSVIATSPPEVKEHLIGVVVKSDLDPSFGNFLVSVISCRALSENCQELPPLHRRRVSFVKR